MRIIDWSSDVCSSDLALCRHHRRDGARLRRFSAELHGGAVGRDHQHGGADHLVVEVDRHHRIGAYGRGLCGHGLEGMLLGITQGLLLPAGASADDISYTRDDVAEQTDDYDGIAGDEPQYLTQPAD